jgi:hypothetical protein
VVPELRALPGHLDNLLILGICGNKSRMCHCLGGREVSMSCVDVRSQRFGEHAPEPPGHRLHSRG